MARITMKNMKWDIDLKQLHKVRNRIKFKRQIQDERLLWIATALLFAFAISYLAPVAQSLGNSRQSYPASVCAPKIGDGTTNAFLAKNNLKIRSIPSRKNKFIKATSAIQGMGTSALLVDGNPGTSFVVSNSNGGLGAETCLSGAADQWFVGGSGGLTSKATLHIVNSGLSTASVDIYAYGKVAMPPLSLKIKANSDRPVFIDALVPGEEAVAVHVATRSGRVTSFLYDQRKKGLSSLGSDFVSSTSSPSTRLVIPTVLQSSSGKVVTSIRLLVPGSLDASTRITVKSGDGEFTPVGFDDRLIKHGVVTDVALPDLTSSTPMALVIDSDQPVVASVLTQMKGGDFAWASASQPLDKLSMNFTGLAPKFVFVGDSISVAISWKDASGRGHRAKVSGDGIAFWNPGTAGIRTISLDADVKKGIIGGVILRNNYQIAYLPLVPSAILETSSLPVADTHALARG